MKNYITCTYDENEKISCVMVDWYKFVELTKSELLYTTTYGYIGSYTPDAWYEMLYNSFDDYAELYEIDHVGIGESDYYYMHFDFKTKEKAHVFIEKLERVMEAYKDETLLAEFDRLPPVKKFNGADHEFFEKYANMLHERILNL